MLTETDIRSVLPNLKRYAYRLTHNREKSEQDT
jgi:hypothetical protein